VNVVTRGMEQLDKIGAVEGLGALHGDIEREEVRLGLGESHASACQPRDGIRVQATVKAVRVVGEGQSGADVHDGVLERTVFDATPTGLTSHEGT